MQHKYEQDLHLKVLPVAFRRQEEMVGSLPGIAWSLQNASHDPMMSPANGRPREGETCLE